MPSGFDILIKFGITPLWPLMVWRRLGAEASVAIMMFRISRIYIYGTRMTRVKGRRWFRWESDGAFLCRVLLRMTANMWINLRKLWRKYFGLYHMNLHDHWYHDTVCRMTIYILKYWIYVHVFCFGLETRIWNIYFTYCCLYSWYTSLGCFLSPDLQLRIRDPMLWDMDFHFVW